VEPSLGKILNIIALRGSDMTGGQGLGYAILLFIEASLGKTRYGSIMGLAIAGVKSIVGLILKSKSKEG